ncbi:MAG: FAD binding domain-containing protein, partial [Betaproteobacteria bacterium]
VAEVGELRAIAVADEVLRIGAAVTLEDAYAAMAGPYPELTEMWERFASPPIRNAGTLGGNVANGSPIGDSMPALIALGARVVLASTRGNRTLALEDLYLGYQKKALSADEIVAAIELPLPVPDLRFRTYKVSKRYDSDISAVCAAFALRLDGGRIAEARIAFGGMAPVPKRAARAEGALVGQPWSDATAQAAAAALTDDYAPLSDLRAGAAYRSAVAANLLQRFYLETRPERPLPTEQVSVFAGL